MKLLVFSGPFFSPVGTYIEVRVGTSRESKVALNVWERKIIRRIDGPVNQGRLG